MSFYTVGQDVVVDIFGIEHQAEVLQHSKGWVLAAIRPDVLADYGAITPRMDVDRTTVCVPETRVKPCQT